MKSLQLLLEDRVCKFWGNYGGHEFGGACCFYCELRERK